MPSITWIDPNGDAISLQSDIRVLRGADFLGMPTIRASEIEVPLQPGSRWRQVNHGPREITLPVSIGGDKRANLDLLARAMDPTRGDGRIRVTWDDNTARELTCRYREGLNPTVQFWQVPVWHTVIVFRAVDPYWSDTADSTVELAPGAAPGFFPFFPLRVGASEATDSATVNNDGQAAAWPVWTIIGPADSVEASNVTVGESWTLNRTVAAGETVTIDARPGAKTVVSSTVGDVFSSLGDGSSLWRLEPGLNDVELVMAGATGASRMVMSWRRRWLSA
jgi:hypothetical protein